MPAAEQRFGILDEQPPPGTGRYTDETQHQFVRILYVDDIAAQLGRLGGEQAAHIAGIVPHGLPETETFFGETRLRKFDKIDIGNLSVFRRKRNDAVVHQPVFQKFLRRAQKNVVMIS